VIKKTNLSKSARARARVSRKVAISRGQTPLATVVKRTCCGVWPIKCRQGSKRNKSNCQFWKKLTFDWLVGEPQDLFGQRPQN
jgi:hypothetical protein